MGKAENSVTKEIWQAITLAGGKLWRNNSGSANYHGVIVKYGIGNPGGSDLIGYTRIEVTPEMVGKSLPVFTAIEAKAPGKKPNEYQVAFIARIVEDNGIAAVCHSFEEAALAVSDWKAKF